MFSWICPPILSCPGCFLHWRAWAATKYCFCCLANWLSQLSASGITCPGNRPYQRQSPDTDRACYGYKRSTTSTIYSTKLFLRSPYAITSISYSRWTQDKGDGHHPLSDVPHCRWWWWSRLTTTILPPPRKRGFLWFLFFCSSWSFWRRTLYVNLYGK